MAKKLNLSSAEIYEKIFTSDGCGYNPFQVDEYLDKIIADYELIEKNLIVSHEEIDEFKAQVATLKKELSDMEIELSKYKSRFANIKPSDNVTTDNIKYIARIRALENFLHQKGFDPEKIK